MVDGISFEDRLDSIKQASRWWDTTKIKYPAFRKYTKRKNVWCIRRLPVERSIRLVNVYGFRGDIDI